MKTTKREKQGQNQYLKKEIWKHRELYLMLLPGAIYLLINNYLPIGGLVLAFKQYNYAKGILGSEWCGLDNFKFLFSTKDAALIIRNTLGYNMVFIIAGTILAIVVAIILNELRSALSKKIYQVLILIPYLVSMVVVSYIVFAFLSADNGFLNNSVLSEKINWYMSPQYWPYILVFVSVWKSFGYNSIIYYATVIGIDTSLYEAAVVDGANRWQRIWHVTLPGLRATIITLTLLAIGRVMYSDFGLFYQVPMNSGLLYDVTTTIDVYVYKGLMVLNDVGRSAAAGFFQSVCGFILVLTANLVVTKIDKDNALF
ncbi:MAG: ABC transporter permease subunit [Eubacteriales bacterium]|nr:ABC transporter permease subunit [Eubacteriales bacterium]